nr:MAG TPA: hypothetical protein [Caudoviricetes sp.]
MPYFLYVPNINVISVSELCLLNVAISDFFCAKIQNR